MEKLHLLKHLEGCGCSISHRSILPLIEKQLSSKNKSPSYTPESVPQNKKMILKDKKSSSPILFLSNIPEVSLTTYQTLDQVSTLKEKDCYKFWDLSKKEKYLQLSWLQEIDWQGLDMSSLNGSVMSLEQKSWFSTIKIQPQKQNLEKISCPLSKFIAVDGMVRDDTKEKIKSFKLRIRPTKEQKSLLNQWAGSSRFLYNKSIGLLTNPKNNTLRSVYDLRDRLVTFKGKYLKTKNNFYNNKDWLKQVPKAIKQGAIAEAKANLSSCYTNLRNGNITSFTAPFKSKKQEMLKGWSMSLEKNNISKKGDQLFIFKESLGEMRYFKTKQLHKLIPSNKPLMDCKIQKSAYNEYFLIVPYKKIPKPLKQEIKNPAAGDPGVRKILTTYSPTLKESMIFGNRATTSLMSHLVQMDHLKSQLERPTIDRKKLKELLRQKSKKNFT